MPKIVTHPSLAKKRESISLSAVDKKEILKFSKKKSLSKAIISMMEFCRDIKKNK